MCEPNRERGLVEDGNDKGGMGGTGDVGDVARGVVEGDRDKPGAGVRDRGLSSSTSGRFPKPPAPGEAFIFILFNSERKFWHSVAFSWKAVRCLQTMS